MNGAAEFNHNKVSYKSLYEYKNTLKDKNHIIAVCASFIIFITGITSEYWFINESPFTLTLWRYVALFAFLYIVIKLSQVSEESVLLISPLGLQTSTAYCVGTIYTKFIPWCAIQDVIVNEAVCGFRMVHYLAVLVKHDSGKRQLLPLLLNSKLRLHEIKDIYRNIQSILKA